MKRLILKNIKESDLSFTYDGSGYMMEYKGIAIGGGATAKKKGKKDKVSLSFFRHLGEITKRDILSGKCSKMMRENIKAIENGLITKWGKNGSFYWDIN